MKVFNNEADKAKCNIKKTSITCFDGIETLYSNPYEQSMICVNNSRLHDSEEGI